MGLPKKLTEQQMKFAYELVTNEGRKTATECAVDAGFAKDSARQYASKLQNPKLYPLVVKYIGELREEWQKKQKTHKQKHHQEKDTRSEKPSSKDTKNARQSQASAKRKTKVRKHVEAEKKQASNHRRKIQKQPSEIR